MKQLLSFQNLLLLIFCLPLLVIASPKKHPKKRAHAKAKVTHQTATHKPKVQPKQVAPTVYIPEKTENSSLINSSVKTEEKLVPSSNTPNDTPHQSVVVITSAFKPLLKNAAKINFTAASPYIDTSKIALAYIIPSQNLFFSYQPVPIKPLAYQIDSVLKWEKQHFVKLGYGNYNTPYAEARFSFGDGTKKMIGVHIMHIDSKGSLPYQQYSKTGIEGIGFFNIPHNTELSTNIFYNNSVQYKYGFQPDSLKFNKDSLKQNFNTIGVDVSLKNKVANKFNIIYYPNIHFNYFTDNHQAKETNFKGQLGLTKLEGRAFSFDLSVTSDITNLKTPLFSSINNNLFYFNPSVNINSPNITFNGGFIPSWDNSKFAVLPNLTALFKVKQSPISAEIGWIGYFKKQSYKSLSSINPWIGQPATLFNAKIDEKYVGFKGTAGKHFVFNGRLYLLKAEGESLFVNDTIPKNNQTFNVLQEAKLNTLQLHGEFGYLDKEKFSLFTSINYKQFTKQESYDKPYGIIPLEVAGSFRYLALKDITLKFDVFIWDGANYWSSSKASLKQKAAFDLNIGVEFPIMPKLDFWLQCNNILNNKYQRWNQYEVLGFQVLGGVIYSFH